MDGLSSLRSHQLQMLAYLAGVLLPATGDFLFLMAGSCCIVALAAALYTAFAVRARCGGALAGAEPLPP